MAEPENRISVKAREGGEETGGGFGRDAQNHRSVQLGLAGLLEGVPRLDLIVDGQIILIRPGSQKAAGQDKQAIEMCRKVADTNRIDPATGREEDCRIELFDCAHEETPEMRRLVIDWMRRYLATG